MESVLAGAAAGALLLGLWVAANRRHLARRRGADQEWGDAQARPDLWTTGLACPQCGKTGGLMATDGDDVWFTCLACNQRHRRQHRA